jgi:hypothetical protein
MAHSPEPWTYEPDGDFYNDKDGTCYVDLNGPEDQDKSRFARIDSGPTARADAALIAAAPKLLRALIELEKFCADNGSRSGGSKGKLCQMARAVLAEAGVEIPA